MSKPVFKIVGGPSPTQIGAVNAASAGLGSILSAGSKAADIFPHDEAGLLSNLHFRLYEAEAAGKRARWFGGRIYNRFSGADPDYIPVSGTHLTQTLRIVGIEAPDFVTAAGKYMLRYDLADQARSLLRERVASAEADTAKGTDV